MAVIEDKCPVCGSRNVGEGLLNNATLVAKGRAFSASRVFAQVCGDCGAVFGLRVEKPQKFSRREE